MLNCRGGRSGPFASRAMAALQIRSISIIGVLIFVEISRSVNAKVKKLVPVIGGKMFYVSSVTKKGAKCLEVVYYKRLAVAGISGRQTLTNMLNKGFHCFVSELNKPNIDNRSDKASTCRESVGDFAGGVL